MEMKETVNSLRAYFIVVAVLSGVSNFLSPPQPGLIENTLWALIIIIGLLFSLAFLVIGIGIRHFLFNSPKLIKTIILLNFAEVLISWLIVLFVASPYEAGQKIFNPVFGGLISWYLWRNTERLSQELLQSNSNIKEEMMNKTCDSRLVIYSCVTAFFWFLLLFSALFIIPRLIPIFASLKVVLPEPTILVLNFSRPISLLILIVIAIACVTLPVIKKSRRWAKNMLILTILTDALAFGSIYLTLTKIHTVLDSSKNSKQVQKP